MMRTAPVAKIPTGYLPSLPRRFCRAQVIPEVLLLQYLTTTRHLLLTLSSREMHLMVAFPSRWLDLIQFPWGAKISHSRYGQEPAQQTHVGLSQSREILDGERVR